jgi:hypothetical protein
LSVSRPCVDPVSPSIKTVKRCILWSSSLLSLHSLLFTSKSYCLHSQRLLSILVPFDAIVVIKWRKCCRSVHHCQQSRSLSGVKQSERWSGSKLQGCQQFTRSGCSGCRNNFYCLIP